MSGDQEQSVGGERSERRLSWRSWVLRPSFADAKRRRKLGVIRTPVAGCHRIALLGPTGGAGTTTTTIALGATLAGVRRDKVIAIDADRGAGTLRGRTDRRTGLEILADDLAPAVPTGFDAVDYRRVVDALGHRYPIILTDLGTGPLHGPVLDLVDQLIIVATTGVDGAAGALTAVDRLSAQGRADLVRRSIAVVSGARGTGEAMRIEDVVAQFQARCRGVIVVPFDESLAAGGAVDLDLVRPEVREAYVDLAALVGEGIARAWQAGSAAGRQARQPTGYAGAPPQQQAVAPRPVAPQPGPGPVSFGYPQSAPVQQATDHPAAAQFGDAAYQAVPSVAPPYPRPAPESPADEVVEARRLVVELAEQAALGREVPLHVQITRGVADGEGTPLRPFALPPLGARVVITVSATGLEALGDLQQEVWVTPGRDSDVLRFGFRTVVPGLHALTVRAFRGGTFLGEARCSISVVDRGPTRRERTSTTELDSLAVEPGEVTLQVTRGQAPGSYGFQLIGETWYAPELFSYAAGDPHSASERIYAELRETARAAAGDLPAQALRQRRHRLRSLGVQLWAAAVPEAVRRQFWEQAERITAFTVLGEHDAVPWELLYPVDEGSEDRGFLAEWLPVVRRVHGQDRVRRLSLPGAAFVLPPGSPPAADREVRVVSDRLRVAAAGASRLSERDALTAVIEDGHTGLLHFACHNSFTGAGSSVTMADGTFEPIDLAVAVQRRSLRAGRPLVFFNACRSAGEIGWFGDSLGWAPQFLRAGAGAFVGTLWPVRDATALAFADRFYQQLIGEGLPLGTASLHARQAIKDLDGDPTWLAYAVYGSPGTRVEPAPAAGGASLLPVVPQP
ncbi:CHAT domain-containing protein [Kitasatospora sp. LaBMicrA B282]|uniref:CHAT domain-containing protein n=1 Tax=Kitasatospora sp. LaBMicrA B282 TaxID=3420949 RepID=UPI003D0D0EEB